MHITLPRAGLLAALCLLAGAPAARADTVTEWNDIASTAIVATAGQPPPSAELSFAMVQGAVYDAVNAIDRGHRPYLVQPAARPTDSKDAAAATAAFGVLDGLFSATQHATLQARYDASLAAIADVPPGAKAAGIAIGTQAAAAMLAARSGDGRFGPFTPVYGTTPGVYRPTPPLFAPDPAPWVGNVRPFVVPSVEMLRLGPPKPLTSRSYARDFNEIKSVGALHSTTRTADQTDAAIFWQDHGFALWNRAFRTIATDRALPIADSARMFAMADLAGADGAIGCWNNKYRYNFWRPVTAIREAAGDGNPLTVADTGWTPLFDPATPVAPGQAPLVTPPFPEYPSGHNCAAGSILTTLYNFFGTDRVPFSLHSNKSGTTRSFDRLSDVLRESINARIWGGIHFRSSDVQGARLGIRVAGYLRDHYFQPACRSHSPWRCERQH
ncbi:vanadium-dependent haloperoxidase [Solirubrobacter ginsenosidimutans]|uniref:Vanadium-dependent haloperoxidase n=1 Tax=Solirubrobacter ginsenosidimutans TaxID=490573 RepID=A0A9X3N3J1_9ACTN|nr:vanadium-dependent haloperoxidase [Solirubrobacter ginsenosidimutans]MDA0166355.1 vanadium-dependent haloperoxidase [Solirubrobacter ginsenosidimutans]